MQIQHNVTTMEDVKAFLEQIASEITDFHLLTDFNYYVRPQSYFRRYTEAEAMDRNKALDQCIAVCDVNSQDCFAYIPWYYDICISDQLLCRGSADCLNQTLQLRLFA